MCVQIVRNTDDDDKLNSIFLFITVLLNLNNGRHIPYIFSPSNVYMYIIILSYCSLTSRKKVGKDHGFVIFSTGFNSRRRRLYFGIILNNEQCTYLFDCR